jgi:hypothetical protein
MLPFLLKLTFFYFFTYSWGITFHNVLQTMPMLPVRSTSFPLLGLVPQNPNKLKFQTNLDKSYC